MDFVGFQLERVSKGEIVASTIRNYYKATKLFCEMNLALNARTPATGLSQKTTVDKRVNYALNYDHQRIISDAIVTQNGNINYSNKNLWIKKAAAGD
jgi:hypothetical protein